MGVCRIIPGDAEFGQPPPRSRDAKRSAGSGREARSASRRGYAKDHPMLVVMQSHAADSEVARVVEVITAQGLTPHVMPGATRTAIGITGNTGAVDKSLFEVLPGV